jgi:predicted DsbA family dithiol-disulfide isomerase
VIEVYADVVCPFTHVGLERLFRLRDELGRADVEIRVHAWPLEVVNGAPPERELIEEEVAELTAQVAPDLFEGFDARRFPFSTLPALALAARAYRESTTLGESTSLTLRHELFEHGTDVGDPDVLAEVAQRLGVPTPEDRDRAAVLADLDEGRRRGVVGSPHFFVDDGDYFCPTLQIARRDGGLHISFDATAFSGFIARAFRRPPSA